MKRDLYLVVLPEGGYRYAVVTDGGLNNAAAFTSRDAAVMELRRPGDGDPLTDTRVDLGAPGVVAERIAGMTERPARARAGDRQTSHDAARSVAPDTTRGRVLSMLRNRCGPSARFTLVDAVEWYGRDAAERGWPRASDSSIRTRVSELVDDGFLAVAPERGTNAGGRSVTLFHHARVTGVALRPGLR